ncbi:MAG TPA: hypothetical protein PK622_04080, partial [Saprospiraceae bacterium]|nr:hypothetical protein [Saprospiraceae bacterium]
MIKLHTYCLTIDIVASTKKLLEVTTVVKDKFNIALSEIIQPFLIEYELEDAIVKFTGDGWNINITQHDKLTNLLAFILTFNKLFDERIRQLTKIDFPSKWYLRSAISYGLDIQIEFNKNTDFVGDSIRRAVRISSFCDSDEILIDSAIRGDVIRDFILEIKQIEISTSGKKFEYDLNEQLYLLKAAKFDQLETAAIILKHFDDIKNVNQKREIIDEVIMYSRAEKITESDQMYLDTISITLIQIGEKSIANKIYQRLKAIGYSRNLTYWNKLMNKVEDFVSAKQVFNEMKQEGIKPNEVSYSILMNKVEDFVSAKQVLDEMKQEGIK